MWAKWEAKEKLLYNYCQFLFFLHGAKWGKKNSIQRVKWVNENHNNKVIIKFLLRWQQVKNWISVQRETSLLFSSFFFFACIIYVSKYKWCCHNLKKKTKLKCLRYSLSRRALQKKKHTQTRERKSEFGLKVKNLRSIAETNVGEQQFGLSSECRYNAAKNKNKKNNVLCCNWNMLLAFFFCVCIYIRALLVAVNNTECWCNGI